MNSTIKLALVIAAYGCLATICLASISHAIYRLEEKVEHKMDVWESHARFQADKERMQDLEIAETKIMRLEKENEELKIRNDELNKFFGRPLKK